MDFLSFPSSLKWAILAVAWIFIVIVACAIASGNDIGYKDD
jgi:hypothetical protein